jgi:antitoxin component of MazEF toxin-antitoxin module
MTAATRKGTPSTSEPVTFPTTIRQTGNNTGVPVPDDVVELLGAGKRPLVVVSINEHTYRSAVASMGGAFMIALSAENRVAAGVQGGDEVEVSIRLDLEPRTVPVPADLRAALAEAGALAAFEASAPSRKKEDVRQVEEAKTPDTRQRRVAKIVAKLKGA